MKKWIVSIIMLFAAASLQAQEAASAEPQKEWLPSFKAIVLDGPFDIELVQVSADEAPQIVYDTKGSYTSKFRTEVKDHVLYVRERTDTRRMERTAVTLRFSEMSLLAVTDAAVTLAKPLEQKMLDLTVSGNASLKGEMKVRDLDANITGHSSVVLTGELDYLTLYLSTATFDATQLEIISARVNSQSGATAKLWVTDRLEGRSSTGGTIHYKGAPELLRLDRKFLSGDVKPLE